jgi:starch synthase
MASLLPVYLKHYYKDEGIFEDTKIITSVYTSDYEGALDLEMINKLAYDNIPADTISIYKEPIYTNLMKATIDHSDGVIIASDDLSPDLTKYIETSKKPFLPFTPKELFKEAYLDFLKNKVQ